MTFVLSRMLMWTTRAAWLAWGGLLSTHAHINGMLPRSEVVRVRSYFTTKQC